MTDPLVHRELGRLSEAVEGLRGDIGEIKSSLKPVLDERQEQKGMLRAARYGGWVISILVSAATTLGLNWSSIMGGK